MARINVNLSEALLDDLKQVPPQRRRSAFIEQAVREKLARLRQQRALETAAGSWSNEGRGEVEDELRSLRSAWSDRTVDQ